MNYVALRDTIDIESDAITCCLKRTFDHATGNTDDATGITDDMLRMNENTFTFLSPVADILHQDISNNSPSKLKMHTQNTIQVSQKKTWLTTSNTSSKMEILRIIKKLKDYGIN
jgi:hypothetical protein